jgi:peptidoglycan/xylan/chitin deacetylase (PgdA/CDA1 family)
MGHWSFRAGFVGRCALPGALLLACTDAPEGGGTAPDAEAPAPAPVPVVAPAEAAAAPSAPSHELHVQVDGRGFPEHVVALTWDDGPDRGTRALAEYLHKERVSATFFVVGSWVAGVSSDPGTGTGVFASGAEPLPLLGDLVALGHRIGNHTENHALLWGAPAGMVRLQLAVNQRRIDPFLESELALFRAPGGAWNGDDAAAVDDDPALAGLIGPVRWDVDRKDWEASLWCSSTRPSRECEPAAPGGRLRVRPQVVAARYLDSIESARRGIVLLHDRVGHVGSRFALDVAQALVPALRARGYVFAAPVLAFSPLRARFPRTDADRAAFDAGQLDGFGFADIDGDGRADLCARGPAGTACARSEHGTEEASLRPEAHFAAMAPLGDGKTWSAEGDVATGIAFGDLNGDGRTDRCEAVDGAIHCALSTGRGFTAPTIWVAAAAVPELLEAPRSATLHLADVNGDGRADLCVVSRSGVRCGMAP